MNRPSPRRRSRQASRARSLRGFLPSFQALEDRRLLATTINDGDPGFSATPAGAWTTWYSSAYFQGDDHEALAGDGSAHADYTFAGLPAGQSYDVQVTWPAYPNRAPDAPYTITDGTATLGTATVNQQLAPDIPPDSTGVAWHSLGTFASATGTLDVRLSSVADGNVEADAVRIVPVVAPRAVQINAGDPGSSTVGSWAQWPGYGHGGSLDEEALPGDGSSQADFSFTGLASTRYSVQVTWPAYSNRATNAPYTIFGGTSSLGTYQVNQQVSPVGSTDSTGTAWQQLGVVSVADGSLTVELSNLANGNVEADAVRIVPVTAQAGPPAPTGVTATLGPIQARLSWVASSGADTYSIERSADGLTGWSEIAVASATTYTDALQANASGFYYRLRASKAGVYSAYSEVARAYPNAATIDSARGQSLSGEEGQSITGMIAGFEDSDLALLPSDFTATIDWGDGSVTTGVISPDSQSQTGGFGVSGTHSFGHAATYPITVTLGARDGSTIAIDSSVTVAPSVTSHAVRSPSIETNAGKNYDGTVAVFDIPSLDGQASAFTASIDWGDGTVTKGVISPDGTPGEFQVVANHTFTAAGSFPTTVQVDSSDGTSITLGGTAVVTDAPLSALGDSISLDAGSTFDGEVATLDDSNPYAGPSDLSATIDWGDGSGTTAGTIVEDAAGKFSVTGNHSFSAAGAFAIRVTLTDVGGGNAKAMGSANVSSSSSSGTGSLTNVVATPTKYTGRFAATVASYAAINAANSKGSLTIAGIPATAQIVAASLYTSNYYGAAPNPSAIFAGITLGAPTSTSDDGVVGYKWNVTSLVSGNGVYDASDSGLSQSYGLTLLVVYSDPSLPIGQVSVYDSIQDLNTYARGMVTYNDAYRQLPGGPADIWIHTSADDLQGGTGEQIKLNGQMIGGPIDGNQGLAASLFHLTGANVNLPTGTNYLAITTPKDRFSWDLTVITTRSIDLSIDSDNTDGFNAPDQTPNQEKIKDDPTLPGKVLFADTNDDNGDRKPDYANFSNPSPNEQFVPIVLTLPPGIDFSVATITFDCI